MKIGLAILESSHCNTHLRGFGTDTLRKIEEVRVEGGINTRLIDASGYTGLATLVGADGIDTILGG